MLLLLLFPSAARQAGGKGEATPRTSQESKEDRRSHSNTSEERKSFTTESCTVKEWSRVAGSTTAVVYS